ncbi:MAG: hypothetical protein MN733_13620 [Nitrososphaera sp.]|nr:hypothetical protein [Nitrososphaera sp.]
MSDDFVIDGFGEEKPRKRPNSGRIGKGGERELAKMFSERFPKCPAFSRVLGSGNRIWQVQLSEEAKHLMVGDLVCPPNFKLSIECKFGYDDLDMGQAVAEGNTQLEKFLKQAAESADQAKRIPMACWRKKRKPWLAFVPEKDLPLLPDKYIVYKNWVGMSIEEIFKMPESFFFN